MRRTDFKSLLSLVLKKELWVGKKSLRREGARIVILSTSTSTQIPNHKTNKKKDMSKQHSKHMSSY